jgi:hypothetical protein
MFRHFYVTGLIVALALLGARPSAAVVPPTTGSATGPLGVDLDEVFSAWEARPQRAASFEGLWRQREFYRRGSLVAAPAIRPAPGAPDPVAPERDAEVEAAVEMRLDGGRIYSIRRGPQWLSERAAFVPVELHSASDGRQATLLRLVEGGRVEPQAFVRAEARFPDSRSAFHWPLLWALRPLDPHVGPIDRGGAWSLAPHTAQLQGHTCVILERFAAHFNPKLERGEIHETYWVDPARDFCIRRYERVRGGLVEARIEVDYGDDACLWLPTAWRITVFSGEDALAARTYAAELSSHALNGGLADERLRIALPAGTRVDDAESKTAWIVRPDGGKRVITPEERRRGASYAELLATESGQAALPPWGPLAPLAALAVAALLSGLACGRWRRLKATAAQGEGGPPGRRSRALQWATLAALLVLAAVAATAYSQTWCAARCINTAITWSAYRKGTNYRIDFLDGGCIYRAWTTSPGFAYAPVNACAKAYVMKPYYLAMVTWNHPCKDYAATGDLLFTLDPLSGEWEGPYYFPCCDSYGACYGS